MRCGRPRDPGVLRMLVQRSAGAHEITTKRDRIVVRMESPLASMIGVEQQMLERTDGAAQILCWLSRYGPEPCMAVEEAHS